MLRLLKAIFYLIVTAAIIILGGSFLLPSQAVVTRSMEIAAPPEKVFAIVGDLHRLQEFSPWAERDPSMKYNYEGPPIGIGQKVSWVSENVNIGSGSRTITEYDPPRHVVSQLDLGPRGRAVMVWGLEPSGTGTRASWSLTSKLDGIAPRWFGLTLDTRIGPEFERGLAKLKAAAERAETPAPEAAPAVPSDSSPAVPDGGAAVAPPSGSPSTTVPN
ncbi:SRPBCC family protein [Mesorhizobium sp. BAC0120]|uniref:SRPBCC family protein n=1 Tax=Mesorhizobium sp. BAC0120 TaxID=3090670 RepID=UPI00298D2925|nr:SRPBCC family protein [Mesorhizobium sp. BAC0120]MDW6022441.1 SRPBCC family protein [Mesorhizobium sp. BAC0120]